jgi:hypothetical protein
MDRQTYFNETVARCREKQEQHRTMEFRTRLALYAMLAEAYGFVVEMRADDALPAIFYRTLASKNMRRGNDEVLLLVEYLYFPHVLRGVNERNKADCTTASKYAKLIRKAISANTLPVDFVRFAREHGVQKTALAKPKDAASRSTAEETGVDEPPKTTLVEMKRTAASVELPDTGDDRFIGEVWFNSPKLSRRAAEAREAAEATPQVVNVRYIKYPGKEQKVVVGFEAKPFSGPSPDPAVAPLEAPRVFARPTSLEHTPSASSVPTADRDRVEPRASTKRTPQRRIGRVWAPPWPGYAPRWPWQR